MSLENKLTPKLLQWAWLNHCGRNVGPQILFHLQTHSMHDWEDYQAQDWQSLGFEKTLSDSLTHMDSNFAKNLQAWLCASPNHHFIPFNSEHYPQTLREIAHPPIGLYAKGCLEILGKPQIAIVGSRKPSMASERIAHEFAFKLSHSALVVTSGLALGIDAQAHQGALSANGETIAVMATGIDRLYPAVHRALAEKITQKGLLITEFSLGTRPLQAYFPQRNRIISGLSRGVLVVEAALRSGTLTTARHAIEQNKDIFAIPGSVHNPNTQGCHALIRQGAQLVTSPEDILVEWGVTVSIPASKTGQNRIYCSHLGKDAQAILGLMGESPLTIDEIVERLQCPAHEIARHMTELTLEGCVEMVPGGYIRTWRIPDERNCA